MKAKKNQKAIYAAARKRGEIILAALERGNLTARQVADLIGVTVAQANTDLHRLMDKGLAHSFPDPSVQATGKGGLSTRHLYAMGIAEEADEDDRQRHTVRTWKFNPPPMFEPMAFLFGRAV